MPGNSKDIIVRTTIETPLGNMVACATQSAVCLLEFEDRIRYDRQMSSLRKLLKSSIVEGESEYFDVLAKQLQEYFDKKRKQFELPLQLVGTDFQQIVWSGLLEIPHGKTLSYLELSKKLGNSLAIRAVASANAANKIAILIPCHRVIGSQGELTGYAGGIWRKKYLLELEGYLPNGQTSLAFV